MSSIKKLPGKKHCVSIGKNVHVSTQLILCNLKELYPAFKDKHPDLKISFSKFASLEPKWCIIVGPKGTQLACVHSTSKCEVTIVINELKQRLSRTSKTYSLRQKFKRVHDTSL